MISFHYQKSVSWSLNFHTIKIGKCRTSGGGYKLLHRNNEIKAERWCSKQYRNRYNKNCSRASFSTGCWEKYNKGINKMSFLVLTKLNWFLFITIRKKLYIFQLYFLYHLGLFGSNWNKSQLFFQSSKIPSRLEEGHKTSKVCFCLCQLLVEFHEGITKFILNFYYSFKCFIITILNSEQIKATPLIFSF